MAPGRAPGRNECVELDLFEGEARLWPVAFTPDEASALFDELRSGIGWRGTIDGEDVQVFEAEPAPLDYVEMAHTPLHMQNMSTDPYRDVAILSAGSVMIAAEIVAAGRSQYAFAYTGTAGHHASKGGCWILLLQ